MGSLQIVAKFTNNVTETNKTRSTSAVNPLPLYSLAIQRSVCFASTCSNDLITVSCRSCKPNATCSNIQNVSQSAPWNTRALCQRCELCLLLSPFKVDKTQSYIRLALTQLKKKGVVRWWWRAAAGKLLSYGHMKVKRKDGEMLTTVDEVGWYINASRHQLKWMSTEVSALSYSNCSLMHWELHSKSYFTVIVPFQASLHDSLCAEQ